MNPSTYTINSVIGERITGNGGKWTQEWQTGPQSIIRGHVRAVELPCASGPVESLGLSLAQLSSCIQQRGIRAFGLDTGYNVPCIIHVGRRKLREHGPESLSRIVCIPDVQIANLRTKRCTQPTDIAFPYDPCTACPDRDGKGLKQIF